MGRKRPGGHCENRDIVNVDNQLFSPDYDFEGDEGLTWYEYVFAGVTGSFASTYAMCDFANCDSDDADRWIAATRRYFDKEFKPQLAKTKQVINAYTGGAPPTFEQQAVINDGEKLIKSWKEFQDKEAPSVFWSGEFRGYVRSIVQYFDRAACLMDGLNDLADEMGASHISNRAPVIEAKSPPDGGSWIRGGGTGGGEISSGGGMGVLGWVAIGAAGYFGFKVLTE